MPQDALKMVKQLKFRSLIIGVSLFVALCIFYLKKRWHSNLHIASKGMSVHKQNFNYMFMITTLGLERLRLGRYGLAHLRLLQSRLGRLRLELTHVPFRLVPDKSMTAGVMIMLYVSQCRCSCQTFNFARKFADFKVSRKYIYVSSFLSKHTIAN